MSTHLFLHIGRPKVGSSAIQHFLWSNRSLLLSRGLLYPTSVMHQRASHKLALVFQSWNPAYRVVADCAPEVIYNAIFAEAHKTGASKILASSENLFLVDPAKVRDQIPLNCNTSIICYVRRQDDVLVSSLLQEIKTGSIGPEVDIEAYAADSERLDWLDYERVLDRWSRAFGRENIIVRVYEKEQLRGPIYDDILSITGTNTEGLKAPRTGVNVSPARDILDFIVMLNECPESGGGLKASLRIPLLHLSERLGHGGRFDGKQLVPREIRQRVLDRFEKSNANVAKKYLQRKNGVLFLDTQVRDQSDTKTYKGLELERFAHMTAALFNAQQQQIRELREQLRVLTEAQNLVKPQD